MQQKRPNVKPKETYCKAKRDLLYIQVMARYIDDISFSTIRELILLNNVEIVAHIQSDSAFLRKLFQVCRDGGQEGVQGGGGRVGGATCNGHKDSAGDRFKSKAATANGCVGVGGAGKGEKADGVEGAAHRRRVNGFLFLRELFEMSKPLQVSHQVCQVLRVLPA
jgi:hypothetical protein